MDFHQERIARRCEERDPVTDAFLGRVRALTPAEWGRLDAAGAPLAGGSLLARIERASLGAELGLMAVRGISSVLWETFWDEPAELVGLVRGVSEELSRDRALRRDPEHLARLRATPNPLRELLEIAERQPGGPRAAYQALWYALTAVMLRASLPPHARARLYSYAERVIPYASVV